MLDATALTIPYEPRWYQTEMAELAARHRFNVFVTHRQAGKSLHVAAQIGLFCLANPNIRTAMVGPSIKHVRNIFWRTMKDLFSHIPGVEFRESESVIRWPNGSETIMASGENYDSLRGLTLHYLAVDEVGMIPPEAWSTALRPTLSATNGGAIFTGTPQGINLLSELYVYADTGDDPEWCARSYPVDVTGALTPEEIDSARRASLSPNQFLQEYCCDFSVSGMNAICPLEHVIAAQERSLPAGTDLSQFAKVIGCDIGYAGGDATVIFKRQGPIAHPPIYMNPQTPTEIAIALAETANTWRSDAMFVDVSGGYGIGVVDVLQQMGHNPIGINFGSRSPRPEQHANFKAYMYQKMANWVKTKGVLPKGSKLAADLSSSEYDFDPSRRLRIEQKESVRKRLGRSPDASDALALTFAQDILPAGFNHAYHPNADLANTIEKDAFGNKYSRRDPGLAARRRANEFDPFAGTWGNGYD